MLYFTKPTNVHVIFSLLINIFCGRDEMALLAGFSLQSVV